MKYANGNTKSDQVIEAEKKVLNAKAGVPYARAFRELQCAYVMDCDDPQAAVIEWSNDQDASVDGGDIWFNGHWATEEEKEAFIDWLRGSK